MPNANVLKGVDFPSSRTFIFLTNLKPSLPKYTQMTRKLTSKWNSARKGLRNARVLKGKIIRVCRRRLASDDFARLAKTNRESPVP